MAKLREKGSPLTFTATKRKTGKPAEPLTPITALHQKVLEETKVALNADKAPPRAHAIPLPLAFEWALNATGRGGRASWREAIVAIIEALVASSAFWEYSRRPDVRYDVGARWETVLGELEGPFAPRLQQLLGKVHAKA
jgi:hypothetical protein